MIAAIYARKSTEQHGADAEAKSVARQIADARAFAAAKGWTVADAHVYSDDAISGAEVRKLVSRERLLKVVRSGPPFGVLLMRDASRFSRRDGVEAFGELMALAQAGVAVWFVQTGDRFTYGSFGDNVVGFVRAEMNAEHRRQSAALVTAALKRKAEEGFVTGGRVFGYINVRVDGHVEHRINEPEAAIVRRIFERAAAGDGLSRIAMTLNEDRAVCPKPPKGRPAGWSPSSVRAVLKRPRYRGFVIWARTKKRDASGMVCITKRPEAEWTNVERPELRIVTEALWNRAHARRATRVNPNLPAVRDVLRSKYLLSGHARCGKCGGAFSVLSRRHGYHRAFFYGCLAHSKRGNQVCSNDLVLPLACVDDAVLTALATDVLRPAVVAAFVDSVFKALGPTPAATNIERLRGDLHDLDKKIGRLTDAVEGGGALPPLVAKLTARLQERDQLLALMSAAEGNLKVALDRAEIKARVLAQVASWRALLTEDVDEGRRLLREVLAGPLRFTPDGKRYRFEGDVQTGPLVAGLVGVEHPTEGTSLTGFEPVFWP